ncbi:HIT family protein [Brevundimonas sp.]|uniref:HIT domain-containing protein n=1 Tax=Brevundimonas sp. TaxID=1871086 RepID=UPI001A191453|nr:HIT family protein [Brevundimonas sp.]MBJ7485208.1 HIT domain-containing protein [Brevundimonas sp.]
MTFEIDPRLLANSMALPPLGLSDLRLMDDVRFPWLVLIPRVPGATELDDLDPAQRAVLIEEIALAGAMVRALSQALDQPINKLNTAALGNVTAQLHVHIVGRRRDDPLWPDPIWGRGPPVARAEGETARLAALVSSDSPR